MMDFLKLLTLLAGLFLSVAGIVYLYRNYAHVNRLIHIKPDKHSIIDFFSLMSLSGISVLIIFFINYHFQFIKVLSVREFHYCLLRIPEEFIIAFGEEMLLRVFVFFGVLTLYNNKLVALFVSSLMFSLLHNSESVVSIFSYFIAGIIYGTALIRYHSIWLPVGLHFGWNYFQGPVLGFPVSGYVEDSYLNLQITESHLLNGGNIGPENSILGVCMRFFILIFILLHTRNQTKKADFLNVISN